MAEFEDKLNAILGDPEAMEQIVSIAKALTGEQEPAPAASPDPPPEETPPAAPNSQPDWQNLLGLLGGLGGGGDNPLSALGDLDPQLIQTAVTLFSEYSATDDRKVALLAALKPFLKPERQAKVDRAMQLARLARVIRVAFRLFQSNREEGTADV